MLSEHAEILADLTDLAARCAECFAKARSAGADIKAIGLTAKAALALDAGHTQLAVSAHPFADDRQYLDEIAEIRAAIRQRIAALRNLITRAEAQREAAIAAMAAAMACDPPDYGAYAMAHARYVDATHAIDLCEPALAACEAAERCLAWAPVRYAQVYETPAAFAAQGGLLPHEGRWIQADDSPALATTE